jgi:hypothetical protein
MHELRDVSCRSDIKMSKNYNCGVIVVLSHWGREQAFYNYIETETETDIKMFGFSLIWVLKTQLFC